MHPVVVKILAFISLFFPSGNFFRFASVLKFFHPMDLFIPYEPRCFQEVMPYFIIENSIDSCVTLTPQCSEGESTVKDV